MAWGGRLAVLVFLTLAARAAAACWFFERHGAWASHGADIWFFAGAAKGCHNLFWGDPLRWLLPLAGGFSPETIYAILWGCSNALNLAAVIILYFGCREVYSSAKAAFWASLAFVLGSSSLNYCTASFHHQQEVFPVLMLSVWMVLRLMKSGGWGAGCLLAGLLLLAAGMGPDAGVVAAWLLPLLLERRLTRSIADGPRKRWIQAGILLGWLALAWCLKPGLVVLHDQMAMHVRGIDLAHQRQLNAADLLPFGWSCWWNTYGVFSVLGAGLLVWGWWRDRFAEVSLVVTAGLFAGAAARFSPWVEMPMAWLLAAFLANEFREGRQRWMKWAGAIAVTGMFLTACWRGLPCFYPGNIVAVLKQMPPSGTENARVLCSPTYGFVIRGVTGAPCVTDWHHLDDRWIRLASNPLAVALPELRKEGITHLFFTSDDCRVGVGRTPDGMEAPVLLASGGFERALPDDVEDVKASLVWRALAEETLPGLRRLAAQTDRRGRVKAVLWAVLP
ncbi:MAG: hypothetical protein PHV34_02585 [Verrucomicrobiae bacterium]|nr:hypothetical protein [Verrucomicrobiae bacterium]